MLVGKLYMFEESPACRAVMLAGEALGIQFEMVQVKVLKGDQKSSEFLKMNPAHAVPTFLDNDGNAIGDSHTIMSYLVSKYGKDDKLYPNELLKRAAVQQLLHFHSGNMFSMLISIVGPMYAQLSQGPTERQIMKTLDYYDILNTFLEGRTWAAGTENPTLADFSLVTTIDSLRILVPMDEKKCPNIIPWIKRCEALPYYGVNKKGEDAYRVILKGMLNNKYDCLKEWLN